MALLRLLPILLFSLACCCQDAPPQPITAEAIMARVAANQDRAEKLRAEYVYQQRVKVATRRTNGKLVREETADYHVVPTPGGTKKRMVSLIGRYKDDKKNKYVDFNVASPSDEVGENDPSTVPKQEPSSRAGDKDHNAAPAMQAGVGRGAHVNINIGDNSPRDAARGPSGIDRDLVKSFRQGLTNAKTKDGISRNLFPLTTKAQEEYQFRLVGEEKLQGRPVYHIKFMPKDKKFTWAGEAFVDKEDFQPVMVSTKLSRRIPFAVRTFLGTDLPGVGFNVKYGRQADGVWFPLSFGTEFRLRVLFFLSRDIAMSVVNSAFEHTDVKSAVKYEPQ